MGMSAGTEEPQNAEFVGYFTAADEVNDGASIVGVGAAVAF